jgi:hypothetical protein
LGADIILGAINNAEQWKIDAVIFNNVYIHPCTRFSAIIANEADTAIGVKTLYIACEEKYGSVCEVV